MKTSFEQELRRYPPIRTAHRTACKYRQIRERIGQCAGALEPGTQLPPLRKLSKMLGTTLPTLWRAIRELVDDGVLHTRARSGILVAQPRTDRVRGGDENPLAAATPRVRTLTLLADTLLPHQQRFWKEAVASFQAEHRYIRVRLEAALLRAAADEPRCDLSVIHWPGIAYSSPPEASLRDLEPLLGQEATRPFPGIAFPDRARRRVPFRMTVPCLFVNLKWLKDNAIRPPVFDHFDQVRAFVGEAMARLAKRPPERPGHILAQSPLRWLGRGPLTLIDKARTTGFQPASRAFKSLVKDAKTALSAWQELDAFHIRHGIRTGVSILGFAEGRSGFYFGQNYHVGVVAARRPDFPWQVIPVPAVDDRVPVMLQCLAVDARTPHVFECARFIKHVLSPDSQRLLAREALVPLDPRHLAVSSAPEQSVFTPAWHALRDRMTVIYPGDEAGDDVYQNIFPDDLYRCFHGNGTIALEDALADMWRHAHAYFRATR